MAALSARIQAAQHERWGAEGGGGGGVGLFCGISTT